MPPSPTAAHSRWSAQMFAPFPQTDRIVFARIAARSAMFEPTGAGGGARVLLGCAAGEDAGEVGLRARSELVERISNVLAGRAAESDGGTVATFDQLRRDGARAVDPASLDGHAAPAEARAARQLWVSGRSLLTGEELLVPAGAAFLHHRPPAGCTATTRAGSTGVAAHATAQAATDHAALEVLERDLIRRSWYEAAGVARMASHEQPSPGAALDELLARLDLPRTLLVVPSPPHLACIVACLHTADGRQQSFGARCAPVSTRGGAVTAALYEALMVRWSMGTPVALRGWAALRSRRGPPRDELEHALWAFHAQDSLAIWLGGPARAPQRGHTQRPRMPASQAEVAGLLATHTGEDVVAVDTTTAEARAEGLSVVRVVAPGARALPTCDATGTRPHPFG